MSESYRIRLATREDVQAIGDLSREAFTDTFVDEFKLGYHPDDLEAFLQKSHSPAYFTAALAAGDRGVWVAETDDGLAGYALCGPCDLPHADVTPADIELYRLYVLKSWHGTGVARDLMAVAMDWMATYPAQWLGVWSQNIRAQKFYARYGFEKAGEYDYPVGRTLDREFILRRTANRA